MGPLSIVSTKVKVITKLLSRHQFVLFFLYSSPRVMLKIDHNPATSPCPALSEY